MHSVLYIAPYPTTNIKHRFGWVGGVRGGGESGSGSRGEGGGEAGPANTNGYQQWWPNKIKYKALVCSLPL